MLNPSCARQSFTMEVPPRLLSTWSESIFYSVRGVEFCGMCGSEPTDNFSLEAAKLGILTCDENAMTEDAYLMGTDSHSNMELMEVSIPEGEWYALN